MAGNVSAYLKSYQQNNKATVDRIFDDLEKFQAFCVEFGIAYNPAHLYRENSNSYKDFLKYQKGRDPRNRWIDDAKKFANDNE